MYRWRQTCQSGCTSPCAGWAKPPPTARFTRPTPAAVAERRRRTSAGPPARPSRDCSATPATTPALRMRTASTRSRLSPSRRSGFGAAALTRFPRSRRPLLHPLAAPPHAEQHCGVTFLRGLSSEAVLSGGGGPLQGRGRRRVACQAAPAAAAAAPPPCPRFMATAGLEAAARRTWLCTFALFAPAASLGGVLFPPFPPRARPQWGRHLRSQLGLGRLPSFLFLTFSAFASSTGLLPECGEVNFLARWGQGDVATA